MLDMHCRCSRTHDHIKSWASATKCTQYICMYVTDQLVHFRVRHARIVQEVMEAWPPGVVMVELHPAAVAGTGYEGGAIRLLQRLYDWGYTGISHSGCGPELCFPQLCRASSLPGIQSPDPESQILHCSAHFLENKSQALMRPPLCRYVCDERWYNITRSIRLKGAMGLAAQDTLKQPTWCRLHPENFAALVQRASAKFPENLLFTYKAAETVNVTQPSATGLSQLRVARDR